jgi:hypothetical protein
VRPRRQHLLVQHLENLSRKVLEDFQDIIREYVKGRRGLYALYRRDKLQYVGLASDLRSRLRAHLRDRHAHTWDSFSLFLTLGADSLRELEALLIRIAKPRGNRSKTRFPRSQDLRKVFRRQVQAKQHKELESLFVEGRKRGRKRTPPHGGASTPLGPHVHGRLAIKMTRKGRTYRALVRSDGTIRFRGKVFQSPSTAASEVTGRPMNGWWWWKYERAPGEWVRIDELRK